MPEKQLYYIGDTPLIKIDCVNDISNGTAFKIKYKKPGGEAGEWVGNLSGTQHIEYQTLSTDLDTVGVWLIQAFVDWGTIEKYGNTDTFEVHALFMS